MPGLDAAQPLQGLNPFGPGVNRQQTLDQIIRTHAFQILGPHFEILEGAADAFFSGTHQRLSTLSRYRFYERLRGLGTQPNGGLLMLCLCIWLVERKPSGGGISAHMLPYVTLKSLLVVLESAGDMSLDIVQCKLIMTWFELGHGLHTAAYISIGACARSARALSLHKAEDIDSSSHADVFLLEEKRRTWWVIMNVDRYLNLCNPDTSFVAADPQNSDRLPIDDLIWVSARTPVDLQTLHESAPILATPAQITVGQTARECQLLHLAGRVVRNLFEPTPDLVFNAEEANRLEHTLDAYLPLLAQEELKYGNYCGALAIRNRFVSQNRDSCETNR
jgi:hypothetical protein